AGRGGEERAERGLGVRRDPRGVRPVDVGRRDTTHRLAGRRELLRRGKRVAARAGPDLQQRDSSHRREEGDHGMTPPDWTSAATRPEMDAGLQYHIRCKRGDVERYVLLPGDPERVDLIANYREHRTFSGKVGGVALTCCSTGADRKSTRLNSSHGSIS